MVQGHLKPIDSGLPLAGEEEGGAVLVVVRHQDRGRDVHGLRVQEAEVLGGVEGHLALRLPAEPGHHQVPAVHRPHHSGAFLWNDITSLEQRLRRSSWTVDTNPSIPAHGG